MAREHFPRPNAPELTKENMFEFVVTGAQTSWANQQNGQQQNGQTPQS